MAADTQITIGTAAKIGLVCVPILTTAAVALYRVGEAETRIAEVEEALAAETVDRAEGIDAIHAGQREMVKTLTEIKIQVGVLCQAVDGARCP